MFPVQFVIFCCCNYVSSLSHLLHGIVVNVALRYLLAFGSKIVISKNASWPLTQKLRTRISSLISSPVIADLYCNCSPVNGINFVSTSTSFHTSLNMFAVKSQKYCCDVWRLVLFSYSSYCVENRVSTHIKLIQNI